MARVKDRDSDSDSMAGIWVVLLIYFLFFARGCDAKPSKFEVYLKAAHGYAIEGLDYDDTE